MRARCQTSWWSTSATDAPTRFWSCAFAERRWWRFSFSECASGKWSSQVRIPTQPLGIGHSSRLEAGSTHLGGRRGRSPSRARSHPPSSDSSTRAASRARARGCDAPWRRLAAGSTRASFTVALHAARAPPSPSWPRACSSSRSVTCSAAASSASDRGPPKTSTESADARAGEMPIDCVVGDAHTSEEMDRGGVHAIGRVVVWDLTLLVRLTNNLAGHVHLRTHRCRRRRR